MPEAIPYSPHLLHKIVQLEEEVERLRQENQTLRLALDHVELPEGERVAWLRPTERTIYRILRRQGYASYEQLAAALTSASAEGKLQDSKRLCHVVVHKLRKKGYEIQTMHCYGYRLVRDPPELFPEIRP